MSDIITERSGNILRIQLNRPQKKNAMTSAMYVTLAGLLNNAAKDDQIRVVFRSSDRAIQFRRGLDISARPS